MLSYCWKRDSIGKIDWENIERWEKYNIAEKKTSGKHIAKKKTVWRIWILVPGANLKDLMEHINVKNKIITFKDKSATSTSFDPQNSGKEKKETNL